MFNFPARSRFNTAATKPLTVQSDIFAANEAVMNTNISRFCLVYSTVWLGFPRTLKEVKEFISETPVGVHETRKVIRADEIQYVNVSRFSLAVRR